MNVVKQIRVDMNHGELFKVVLRWPCFDVFRSPFSVLSFVSVPVFQFCVLKFYRFEIAHLRRFRACYIIFKVLWLYFNLINAKYIFYIVPSGDETWN